MKNIYKFKVTGSADSTGNNSTANTWIKTYHAIIILVLFIVLPGIGLSQIAAWQLNGAAGNEATIAATTLDANLNPSVLARGGGLSTTTLANAFNSTSYTVSGTKPDAVTNSDFVYFTINAKPGFKVSLSTLDARFRRSNTGPITFRWQYSTDGSNFTDIGTDDISFSDPATNGIAQAQINLSGIPQLQEVQNPVTITIRLLGWGASGGTGTFAIGRSTTTGLTDFSLAIGGIVVSSVQSFPPTLNPDITDNNVDNNIDITFTDDPVWRAAITTVQVNGFTLTPDTDYEITAGNLQLIPSGLNPLLTTPGSLNVTVDATSYSLAGVIQEIETGAAAQLLITTQPVAPLMNGFAFTTQPVVELLDQYDNPTTATNTITAEVGAGAWTIGGTTSIAAVNGTSAFTDLTASSAAAVTGATISFTSGSLTGATSDPFNLPAPPRPIGWANLQSPEAGNIVAGTEFLVYARVYAADATPPPGSDPGMQAWIGYSTVNNNPATWTNWIPATFNVQVGNDDEYLANLGAALIQGGTYYYASRFRLDGVGYSYGGYSAGGGGFWDSTNYVSGVLTASTPEPLAHVTDFTASGVPSTSASIILTWQDSDAARYLIKASDVSFEDIIAPVDGIAEANSLLAKNVSAGSGTVEFTELTPNTTYYFKIYPYNGTASQVNYKTNDVVPQSLNTTASELTVGSVLFVQYGTDNPDKIAFITTTDLDPYTSIYFTDNAYNGSTFSNSEGILKWTSPETTLAKGTVVTLTGTSLASVGTVISYFGLFALAAIGDQVLAYQGSLQSPVFIAGISSTGWISGGVPNSNQSYLPAALTINTTAVSFSSEIDNGYYSGPVTLANGALASFVSNSLNWTRSDAIQTSPAWAFTIGDATIVESTATVEDLMIEAAETLTLMSGANLTVTNTLGNDAGDAGLVVESDASLIENSPGVAATVKRNITNGAWHLISIPNNSTTANTFIDDYLQWWDEPTANWTDIIDPATALNPMQGYGLWNASGGDECVFTGELNTGTMTRAVSYTPTAQLDNDGANLLGNPYPCFIDWSNLDDFWGAVYYWNGTAYVSWNDELGDGSQFVPPMQGFFIIAPTSGIFELSNNDKAHSIPDFYKSVSDSGLSNTLVLATMGEAYSDKLFINFNSDATEEYDLIYDAYKLLAFTPGQSELYSFTGDKKLSIDVRPQDEVIQLGFRNDQSGIYQFGIHQYADIPVAYIEDTKTSTYHDLFTGPYSFNYTVGDSEKRFLLHFGTTSVDENKPVSKTSIYSYQQTVYVNLDETVKGDIYIYNIAGQLVKAEESAMGHVRIVLSSTGVYMVKVITEKETLTQKVWIR